MFNGIANLVTFNKQYRQPMLSVPLGGVEPPNLNSVCNPYLRAEILTSSSTVNHLQYDNQLTRH